MQPDPLNPETRGRVTDPEQRSGSSGALTASLFVLRFCQKYLKDACKKSYGRSLNERDILVKVNFRVPFLSDCETPLRLHPAGVLVTRKTIQPDILTSI